MNCPFNGEGGDQITRGFYITGFPGNRLDTVTLHYFPEGATSTTMILTARLDTYNGALVGTATVNADFSVEQTVTYDFGGAVVPVNSLITFTQAPDGGTPPDGYLFYDTGSGPCAGFTETGGTTPPLDSFRRDSIGALITGRLVTGGADACLPLPDGSVVGDMPTNTQAYYAPGQIAAGVVVNAGTYWVLGVDESGSFYKILLACDYLWVPVGSMQPSFQSPWSGQPLPTQVVS